MLEGMLAEALRRLASHLPAPAARAVERLAGSDAVFLLRAFLVVGAVWAFVAIAGLVSQGATRGVDETLMRAFRAPGNPGVLRGPAWVEGSVRDITALGGMTVLVLFTLAVAVFLGVRRQTHALVLVVVASLGGLLLSNGLKLVFQRPRPDVVPHLARVDSTSFPSGHAVSSAVVYLTLGALLSQLVQPRKQKAYFLGVACVLTFLVGLSRVVLGVHYPSDVLAGWAAGLAWALVCWMAASWLQRRGTVEKAK
jgi:undecaprenyl-diphosphatase